MAFKVRIFPGTVDYEALHAAKLTDYPLESRDYKPFAQGRICFAQQGLHIQLLSFEAAPLPDSQLRAVLRFPGQAQALEVAIYGDRRPAEGPRGMAFQPFSGEDLQGVYWGGNITISPEQYAPFTPGAQAVFQGNFYKICRNPARPHYGSYLPIHWELPLDDPKNLGEFLCIDY